MGNDFNNTVSALFQGLDGFISSKTVVGEPITVNDTIILPLIDVSIGIGAGAFSAEGKKNNAGGGLGGKMSPSAVLVISNGKTKLVNVKNQEGLTKILDMAPDVIDKITSLFGEDSDTKSEKDKKDSKESSKQEDHTKETTISETKSEN